MSNQPLDKGRVSVIAEQYPDAQNVMKNRYATVGKATLWPPMQGKTQNGVEVELDTMPIGHTGKLKLYIFWDSEQQNQQQAAPQQQNQYQQPQGAPQQGQNFAQPQYQGQPNQR